jgi:hypothetical protein
MAVKNAAGMRLVVDSENTQPALRIVVPGNCDEDRSIVVLFPEHVTAKKAGAAGGDHLYLFRPGRQGDRPAWRHVGSSLEYERDFKSGTTGSVHMLARATLEDDGVRLHYEFTNRSNTSYDMIYAVSDPRLTGTFHDERLERTYVHHKEGFDLLASETPARLSMPRSDWLPSRYLASFTWPVPAKLVERRDDGITYYNKSRPVDQPLVATLSSDREWVVASFTRETGNVWSNPELTCQHVDPQTPLAPGQQAALEVKILVLKTSLDQVLASVAKQRDSLR